MNYDEAVDWVDGFHRFGIQLGLDRIEKVLCKLDNPEKKTSFVHVAGTNGKGSVCRFISSILSSEGYQTGLYLSPHLIDFRERFQLNDAFIEKEEFAVIVKQIKPVIESCKMEGVQLTYFEVCTIIAFVFFAKKKVDYAVVEVGLGGRLDATNVIHPLVSVITNVSFDHQKQLGETIQEIASEKAGIIKPKIPVVTAADYEALDTIRSVCDSVKAPLNVVTKDMISIQESVFSHQKIIFQGFFDEYVVTTHQLGLYQPINIGVSIAVIEALQQQGVFVPKESISKGILTMNHPGRMQVIHSRPFIVLDGAHNVSAMNIAVESITSLFDYDRLIIVFGAMKDKSIEGMLRILLKKTSLFIVTKPNLDRAVSVEEITDIIYKLDSSIPVVLTDSVAEAYDKACEIATEHDLIFVTGSLFTIAEMLTFTDRNSKA